MGPLTSFIYQFVFKIPYLSLRWEMNLYSLIHSITMTQLYHDLLQRKIITSQGVVIIVQLFVRNKVTSHKLHTWCCLKIVVFIKETVLAQIFSPNRINWCPSEFWLKIGVFLGPPPPVMYSVPDTKTPGKPVASHSSLIG